MSRTIGHASALLSACKNPDRKRASGCQKLVFKESKMDNNAAVYHFATTPNISGKILLIDSDSVNPVG